MIFKAAMSKDFAKIESLAIIGHSITNLIQGCQIMRRMPKLQELNLMNNRVTALAALSELK